MINPDPSKLGPEIPIVNPPDSSLPDSSLPDSSPLDSTVDAKPDGGMMCTSANQCVDNKQCTVNRCVAGMCDFSMLIDFDNDNSPAMMRNGETCDGGKDCDDTRDGIYPDGTPGRANTTEICGDGVDQNCNDQDNDPRMLNGNASHVCEPNRCDRVGNASFIRRNNSDVYEATLQGTFSGLTHEVTLTNCSDGASGNVFPNDAVYELTLPGPDSTDFVIEVDIERPDTRTPAVGILANQTGGNPSVSSQCRDRTNSNSYNQGSFCVPPSDTASTRSQLYFENNTSESLGAIPGSTRFYVVIDDGQQNAANISGTYRVIVRATVASAVNESPLGRKPKAVKSIHANQTKRRDP